MLGLWEFGYIRPLFMKKWLTIIFIAREQMHGGRPLKPLQKVYLGASKVKELTTPHLDEQEEVNAYFQTQSSFWKNIYADKGVYAEIHRNRQAVALAWIDSLALSPDSQVLEVGCGAGFVSIALAQHGFEVQSIDSVEAMVDQAHRHAEEAGVAARLSLNVGDIYALAFEDESFDLVVALGVIPWLERPELAIQEIARVLKPGGCVILTADNRARLNNLLDPWMNPALSPLKRQAKNVLVRLGFRRRSVADVGATSRSRRFIDNALARVGLVKIRGVTLGFGPFSLFRRKAVPEPLATALHYRLQRLADRNIPVFRSTGAHYIVLAKKSRSGPSPK